MPAPRHMCIHVCEHPPAHPYKPGRRSPSAVDRAGGASWAAHLGLLARVDVDGGQCALALHSAAASSQLRTIRMQRCTCRPPGPAVVTAGPLGRPLRGAPDIDPDICFYRSPSPHPLLRPVPASNGRFGAVYRAIWRGREVAVKKTLCFENEVSRASVLHATQALASVHPSRAAFSST